MYLKNLHEKTARKLLKIHKKLKKLFLKILQNFQENTWVGVSFLIKLQETPSQVFSVNFLKFLGTLIL